MRVLCQKEPSERSCGKLVLSPMHLLNRSCNAFLEKTLSGLEHDRASNTRILMESIDFIAHLGRLEASSVLCTRDQVDSLSQ